MAKIIPLFATLKRRQKMRYFHFFAQSSSAMTAQATLNVIYLVLESFPPHPTKWIA